jgi:AraC family transcriptional regulator, regulatory protein of adaptative response / methylated-DNA-[protein]-cysteine methyltransferase
MTTSKPNPQMASCTRAGSNRDLSLLAQSRWFDPVPATSGLPPATDTFRGARHVAKVPIAAVFGPDHRHALAEARLGMYHPYMLDFDTSYSALRRRDPSLDGVVFAAVKTTGIYCRPVCRVRTPLARNVLFYPSAAAAERAGYRPCFRCRPETAPFCPAWKGTRTTVERALALIEAGALDEDSVAALAARLGIGARHLSRLFADHLDASPAQVAQSLRIQRAKRLLDDTDLSVSLIAERAGYRSSRRMTAAFLKVYGRPPSALGTAKRMRAGAVRRMFGS